LASVGGLIFMISEDLVPSVHETATQPFGLAITPLKTRALGQV
jgi:hypothetical protein